MTSLFTTQVVRRVVRANSSHVMSMFPSLMPTSNEKQATKRVNAHGMLNLFASCLQGSGTEAKVHGRAKGTVDEDMTTWGIVSLVSNCSCSSSNMSHADRLRCSAVGRMGWVGEAVAFLGKWSNDGSPSGFRCASNPGCGPPSRPQRARGPCEGTGRDKREAAKDVCWRVLRAVGGLARRLQRIGLGAVRVRRAEIRTKRDGEP